MSPVPIDTVTLDTASLSEGSRRFADLRGVQWRIDLGILPSSPSASVDDLRRVTANSRRRPGLKRLFCGFTLLGSNKWSWKYLCVSILDDLYYYQFNVCYLRRRLLVDPHVPKDGGSSPDLVIDNPLSQNPDSMWGRFFRNAELERMVDQDLTRLYPERGSYFQTSGCQSMLRRILLLWCLKNPEYGYRQGMHELLAPLLYVLQVDVELLSEIRKKYDDHFADKFDGFSFHENDLTYKFDFKKFSESAEDGNGIGNSSGKANSLSELDPKIQTIVLLSDAYGAEGELGIVLSEKFMEHDAYSMFDSLMSGAGGAVAMAEFFSPSPFRNSYSGSPPVIEASAALYHLLSIVDSSLHSHLVELGVEPQYFALRWLRVLFGREFCLEDLLVIWDEIFARENTTSNKAIDGDAESNFGVLEECHHLSPEIVEFFPSDVKLTKLLAKAKSLHALALDANNSMPVHIQPGSCDARKSAVTRGHSLSLDSTSPRTPLNMVSDSYWEEKWRVLHKEEENKKGAAEEQIPNRRSGWSERVRLRLSRTASDPSPSKKNERTKIPKPSVRRSLLADLERQLASDDEKEHNGSDEDFGHQDPLEADEQDVAEKNYENETSDKNYENETSGAVSEEIFSNFSDPTGPTRGHSDNENESGRSSVASNSIDENDAESCGTNTECSSLPVSSPPDDPSSKCTENDDSVGKLATGPKERKLLSAKFQWLWKFGRNAGEGTSERTTAPQDAKACNGGSHQNNVASVSSADGCDRTSGTSKGETVDQNLMVSLKNLGQSMLENIQVIESVFQQDRGQMGSLENFSKNGLVGKGQVTAMAALKELRKISNLLSEILIYGMKAWKKSSNETKAGHLDFFYNSPPAFANLALPSFNSMLILNTHILNIHLLVLILSNSLFRYYDSIVKIRPVSGIYMHRQICLYLRTAVIHPVTISFQFLDWCQSLSDLHSIWYVNAATGCINRRTRTAYRPSRSFIRPLTLAGGDNSGTSVGYKIRNTEILTFGHLKPPNEGTCNRVIGD
ncbi:TBC1 domain family member 5 [Sesamum angolense]|uniref:TBC1 domain family member 5 n=1 Tax=Sesamum angolense TaxID=2727404 RepID=A0AAE1WNI3_9LAMI|nr:TBC1 domain family member 5 [Sesamum angolense]